MSMMIVLNVLQPYVRGRGDSYSTVYELSQNSGGRGQRP